MSPSRPPVCAYLRLAATVVVPGGRLSTSCLTGTTTLALVVTLELDSTTNLNKVYKMFIEDVKVMSTL